jgi:tRNA threonylcarbamoyladenosine biosynthesis protein TsaB
MLLALESATELVGIALLEHGEVRYEAARTGRREHAETLAPLVEAGLAAVGVRAADLDMVAVDVGPGLFTGLRVGLAMAKGLAFAAGIGVVPITSLHALARATFDKALADMALSVVDARRGEVFAARFRQEPQCAVPVAVDEPRRYRPEELGAALAGMVPDRGQLALVGDGALRYAGEWRLPSGVVVGGEDLAGPPPRAVAQLASDLLAAGTEAKHPAAVEAVYLREADARINWAVRAGAGAAAEG